jgi:NADH dehydrogenase
MKSVSRIVIVGGGAGGLELAMRLGKKLGKSNQAIITLVDKSLTHLWKPLLHEVAAGTLDSHEDELSYLTHASSSHFNFQLGEMIGLNRNARKIILGSVFNKSGDELVPGRELSYDILIIAVGSISNDFNIDGVKQYCSFLDNRKQADQFQQFFLRNLMRAQNQTTPLTPGQLDIAIVGGGATGVELAAELHYTIRQAVAYGLDRIDPEHDVKLTLIEAANRILAVLPERFQQQ